MSEKDDWLVRAMLAQQMGLNEKAIEAFQRLVQLDPHDADSWNSLGWTYWLAGNPDEAIPCFDRAINENEQCTMAWVNKGIVLKNQGLFEGALNCYMKAIEIPNADAEELKKAWHNMAVAYFERAGDSDDLEEAGRSVAEALKIDPEYPQARHLSDAINTRRSVVKQILKQRDIVLKRKEPGSA